jgi:hypothetical protein
MRALRGFPSFEATSWRVLCVLAVTVTAGLANVASAGAESPWWHVSSDVRPANLGPGGEGTIVVRAVNLGDAPTSGTVVVSDRLPTGLTAQGLGFFASSPLVEQGASDVAGALCEPVAAERVSCSFPVPLTPYEDLELTIKVKVAATASPMEINEVVVTGGEAPTADVRQPLSLPGGAPKFGVQRYELTPEEEGGEVDGQVGSHPFQLTSTFDLNTNPEPSSPEASRNFETPALTKDLQFQLPPGLVGNTQAVAQCSLAEFHEVRGLANGCPADTAIGVASITIDTTDIANGLRTLPVPLFNLVPERGEPARFGFELLRVPVVLDTSVRTGGDYGVTVSVRNITQAASLIATQVTFWGVPGDHRHDQERGWACLAEGAEEDEEHPNPCQKPVAESPQPFLTLPTKCGELFQTSVAANAWPNKANPLGATDTGEFTLANSAGDALALSGCNRLPFDPSIEVAPDSRQGSTPTGLKVDVRVPQEDNRNPNGLASASVKGITVTLPPGMALNPSGAGGLEACSEAEIGFTGLRELDPAAEVGATTAQFTPALPSPFCPAAAKVGTARISSPLIPNALEGAVYLAAQDANPFGSLVALYLVAEDPVSGTLVKLPGEISLDQSTGQITASFLNTPQLPFEDAELHFFGGSRAPLATPAHCGAYATVASFAPWSGGAPSASSSPIAIESGPDGSPCPGAALPFAPSLTGGSTNISAGSFSPFTTTINRLDGQQSIQTVQLRMPAGLSGILAGVALCPEAQANAGTCGPESRIGSTIVSVGLGNEPYSVTGGEVYLTESYEGAPFGLSIVNPAVAGPFDLGKVVVRAKIEVDPQTAALTVTTGAIPHILDGIPLEIQHVNVSIERPGFTFNPTDCNPTEITGSIGSVEGSSSPVAVPFQVTNCAILKFAPKFAVSASGRTSRADGASLTAKLSYPSAAQGTQANIARVKVELPKQLPSRLTTLQKACVAKVFEANPAACPRASIVGQATVHTPLLPVPLKGPAYFVSHGGEAFPSLTIVLQGYGVTVDLVGSTFISKAGITSTTFKTVPDVPFSSFELILPQGPFSALAANGNLCKAKLRMPTTFLAQNGEEIHQSTKIAATGCAKQKAKAKKRKRHNVHTKQKHH